jgi:predicted RND superfamily exporter protein
MNVPAEGLLSSLHRRLVLALIRHARGVGVVAALLSLGAVYFLARLRVNPDVNSLIRGDDPTLALTRHLLGDSPLSRTLILVLRADRAGDLETVLPDLVDRLRASPELKRVVATKQESAGPRLEWIRQAPAYFLPEETLGRLQARLKGPERRAELENGKLMIAEDPLAGKETFLRDPLGMRWIFEEAGDLLAQRFPARLRKGTPYLLFETSPPLAFIRAVGAGDSTDLDFTAKLLGDVEGRLDGVLGRGPVRAELAGGYVTARTQAAIMRRDVEIQFLTTAIGVLLFLVWFTRSWTLPTFVFVPVVLAILWGLAYGTALLGPLNPISMSMAAIVAGLGTDYPIYLLTRFWAQRKALDRDPAIVETQRSLGRPVIGASTTTMAGFLVLLASDFPGLRQFGVVTFLGFTLAVLVSLVLFPALGSWLDRLKPPTKVVPTPWVVRGAIALVGHPAHRVLAIGLLVLGAASWVGILVGNVPVELDLRNTLSAGDPGQKTLERLEGDLGIATSPVFALLDRQTPLEELRKNVSLLREQGAIIYADGPQELIPSPEAVLRADRFRRATRGWVEETRTELGALGFRPEPFRKALEGLKDALEAAPPDIQALSRPELAALRNGVIYEKDGTAWWVITLWPGRSLWLPGDRERWNAQVRAVFGKEVPLLGASHAPDFQAAAVRKDLVVVGGLAIGCIVLLTILSLGRVLDGLLALVPVVTATGISIAVFSMLGGTVKSMNLAAIPILMGIGVDGGIYFVSCLRARGWKDPAGAIEDMGRGYWGATATTILGFGSIATSATPGLAFLGVLVIVGMTACFVGTLYMLPGLLPRRD